MEEIGRNMKAFILKILSCETLFYDLSTLFKTLNQMDVKKVL